MESEKIQEIAFNIILYSGNARSLTHEAFNAMAEGNYTEADEKLKEANDALNQAHNSQTGLLQEYASGEKIEMEVILVHAQDHLMTTMTLMEMATELKRVYQKLEQLEQKG
ncbi:MAG: PTS cellobiose transporter subunit IIA [Aerococcus sp.]|nr:PTS cellobiose transporter subunit IIA [Aerococcus sp.]